MTDLVCSACGCQITAGPALRAPSFLAGAQIAIACPNAPDCAGMITLTLPVDLLPPSDPALAAEWRAVEKAMRSRSGGYSIGTEG